MINLKIPKFKVYIVAPFKWYLRGIVFTEYKDSTREGYKLQTGEQVDCGVGHCIHPGVGSTCGPLMVVEIIHPQHRHTSMADRLEQISSQLLVDFDKKKINLPGFV